VQLLRRLHDKLLAAYRIRWARVAFARSVGVQIGQDCRILGLRRETFGSEPYLVKIGDHVTITAGVRFITHDGGVWVFRDRAPDVDVFRPIVVGNNVFIGINSTLMPGVTVGDNCVIGAGSVVTRDVPAGTVALGVPAKPVRDLESYWEKVQTEALHIRSFDPAAKREFLARHFREILGDRDGDS